MTEILLHSSSSPISSTPDQDDADDDRFGENPISISRVITEEREGKDERGDGDQSVSLLAILATIFRKPFSVACRAGVVDDFSGMDIGLPTNVRHVAHVTFDRYNGFLGLPLELEPDVPRRAPSASATVFGVSTDSMQLSYDSRGNSVPTILLLMQRCLYARGGLQAEGIFRIAAGNSQEEYVRDQLNRGVVPEDIDVHCIAGLIKAWFRELPTGVLDSLSSDQVIQCKAEEDYAAVMRHLPSADAALLDWAINLMADVVQQERENKMNAHNIAVVFAPNMTQVSDPETALTHSVKVMNFLSTLVMKTLRERERSSSNHISQSEPSGENRDPSTSIPCPKDSSRQNQETKPTFVSEEPIRETCHSNELNGSTPVPDLNRDLASETERREVCSSKTSSSMEKLPSSQNSLSSVANYENGSENGKQPGVKVMEDDAGKSLGNKSLTTSSKEKLQSGQNIQSTVTNDRNGTETGKQPGVRVMDDDAGKSLGNKISTTSHKEKLPSSQNIQSTVTNDRNATETGKQPGVRVMDDDAGKSLGNKSSTTSSKEKLPSGQNIQSTVTNDRNGTGIGKQPGVRVMEDDAGKSLGNKSSDSVNLKNSSQEKLPSSQNSQSTVTNEIGKQNGVKLTGDPEANFGDKSLYCMNTMSGRIVEAWR